MKMTLLEGHTFNGNLYGPGNVVELPEDPAAQKRIMDRENAARSELRVSMAEQAATLPVGHPYLQMMDQANLSRSSPGYPNDVDSAADIVKALNNLPLPNASNPPVPTPSDVQITPGSATGPSDAPAVPPPVTQPAPTGPGTADKPAT